MKPEVRAEIERRLDQWQSRVDSFQGDEDLDWEIAAFVVAAVDQAIAAERERWTCITHGLNLVWCVECVEVERKAAADRAAGRAP
jgi:hypothetical protein